MAPPLSLMSPPIPPAAPGVQEGVSGGRGLGRGGGEGGAHGGSHGGVLPRGLAALRLPGRGGGVQPRGPHLSAGGHAARVPGQEQHRFQPPCLYLPQ